MSRSPVVLPLGCQTPSICVRHRSLGRDGLFASIKTLAESGAESVTYYETTGWRGVVEREDTGYQSARFPSLAGGVFPLYHVLREATEHAHDLWRPCVSTVANVVDAAAWQRRMGTSMILVNLTPRLRRVHVDGLSDQQYRARRLNSESWETASLIPRRFRTRGDVVTQQSDGLSLCLDPFETVCLDALADTPGNWR